jgi:hypothetical protein
MRAAVALFLLPSVVAAAEPGLESLASARKVAAQAIEKLKGSKVVLADLDEAEKAASSLEELLVNGAELELTDKAYGKAAQAARRELAAHRGAIAQRGQSIRDREQRAALRKAIDHLNANAQHPPGKILTVEELRVAEAALVAMKDEMDRSRALGQRDKSVAATLSFMDTAIQRHEIGFDEFWLLVLEARRKALSEAKNPKEREAAALSLSELLDETKKSQARSKIFRAAADRARAELR